jgi:hypothetical protein
MSSQFSPLMNDPKLDPYIQIEITHKKKNGVTMVIGVGL